MSSESRDSNTGFEGRLHWRDVLNLGSRLGHRSEVATNGESRATQDSPEKGETQKQADTRLLGHGRLVLSAAMIEEALAELSATSERLLADPSSDMKQVIRLFRLMKDFNRLLLDIGIAEIRAADDAGDGSHAEARMQPFPCGTPLPPTVTP